MPSLSLREVIPQSLILDRGRLSSLQTLRTLAPGDLVVTSDDETVLRGHLAVVLVASTVGLLALTVSRSHTLKSWCWLLLGGEFQEVDEFRHLTSFSRLLYSSVRSKPTTPHVNSTVEEQLHHLDARVLP